MEERIVNTHVDNSIFPSCLILYFIRHGARNNPAITSRPAEINNELKLFWAVRINKEADEIAIIAMRRTSRGYDFNIFIFVIFTVGFDLWIIYGYNKFRKERIMTFQLPELVFSYDALEPVMDAKTVEIHHDKHHAGYTAKLNKALEKYPEFYEKDITEILMNLSNVPEDVRTAVRNNGGGYFHHNLWWEQFTAIGPTTPSDPFKSVINLAFGSFDKFQKKLNAASTGVFGSGWGWLCKDSGGKLVINSTPNQNSPVSSGLVPLIAVDVWEHAYYLKYQNRRAEFVENFWKILDWSVVETRFNK